MAGPGGSFTLTSAPDLFPGIGDSNTGSETIFALGGNDTILAGIGDDVVEGGDGDDQLFGEDGNDLLIGDSGTPGNDRMEGGNGNDQIRDYLGQFCFIDAGAGNDTVQIGTSFQPLSVINGSTGFDTLQTAASITLPANAISGFEALETFGSTVTASHTQFAAFRSIAASGEAPGDPVTLALLKGVFGPYTLDLHRQLAGFRAVDLTGTVNAETFITANGADTVDGAGGNDGIATKGGSDTLLGGTGNDTLVGGTGSDSLDGEAGRDTLNGGTGADHFIFSGLADTRPGAPRDHIVDFGNGNDVIDLTAIDAIAGGTDDAFSFIARMGFSGTAGELHYRQRATFTVVEGDVDGDGIADFQIELQGTLTLRQGDFML